MAMTEFEKKMLQETKGINKELHELNRILKKVTPELTKAVQIDGNDVSKVIQASLRSH